MSKEDMVYGGVKMRPDSPTNLTFRRLFKWVIWQIPRKRGEGLLGAVRPPDDEAGWIPATIQPKEKKARVHAHLNRKFHSPEAAIEYLSSRK
jgi:hypothetical protein